MNFIAVTAGATQKLCISGPNKKKLRLSSTKPTFSVFFKASEPMFSVKTWKLETEK